MGDVAGVGREIATPRRDRPATLRLFLLRHGSAGLRSAWQGKDADRPLTDDGAKQVKRAARRLAEQGVVPDLIVTSPFERAAATARIVAKVLGVRDLVVTDPALAPGFGPAQLDELLRAHGDATALMLVGHEPDLSEVTESLCGGRIRLQKGGLVELEIDLHDETVRPAVLVRLAQPSHLVG